MLQKSWHSVISSYIHCIMYVGIYASVRGLTASAYVDKKISSSSLDFWLCAYDSVPE